MCVRMRSGEKGGEGDARSERSSYVLTVDDTEHSSWSLQIVVCLGVQMYTFLNVGVCEFMSVGECHCLSEYISFMCFHTELTVMFFFVMKTVLAQRHGQK